MPAKQKKKRRKLQSAPPANSSKAQRMVKRLRRQHVLGRKAVEAQKKETSTVEFAAVHNYSEHMMRKMKAFARHYSPEELDALCRGRRPNRLPLHWGYIPVLLAIGRKHGNTERQSFQEHAIENGWTVPQLRREVRKRLGVDGHGRNPKFSGSPTDEFSALVEGVEFIERRCRKLLEMENVNRSKSIYAKCRRLLSALGAARRKAIAT